RRAVRRVDARQVAVELLVAGINHLAVGGVQLRWRRVPALDEADRLLGGQSQCVDHADGGTRNRSSSREGAFANQWSSGRQGRGSSAPRTCTDDNGCAVGGTSARSSSETFPTASRIALSCSCKRATSSSVRSSSASFATWSTCSLVIAIRFTILANSGVDSATPRRGRSGSARSAVFHTF